ncbi:primosomal protein N' [Actinomyces sp. B33]|uniref:primosomal protein N' family DNA-binding protein n=1 Tax=Actinomyces sp. B33 TaxID=2942131 RepID=UPI0023407440|nr:primosomal protein N' [Actinomyces sp. B33]MDC4233321.1 primosomal protein N' [Actinomyces sp. B33]
MDVQETLDGLSPDARPVDVARVLVDTDLPHLDRPLDYRVPDELDDSAQPGRLVRIRLAGRRRTGWILSRDRIVPAGRLEPVEAVVSSLPVLAPSTAALARRIADRHASTMPQVLSLAVPARHAATERAVLAQAPPPPAEAPDPPAGAAWASHGAGPALIRRIASGESPRAVWSALAPNRLEQIDELVAACLASSRSMIVVVPTVRQAEDLHARLVAAYPDARLAGSDQSAADRYRLHLDAQLGRARLVVGTRSAVWTPVRGLGLILVWDDGDDRLLEQRSPRCDALDVAVQRAHLEGASLVCGAYARSVKAQALVRSGWAASLEPAPGARRALAPKIHLHGQTEAEREGAGGRMRIPSGALRLIRSSLERGPVLIQVASSGYAPIVSCDRCRALARCPQCSGPLGGGGDGSYSCRWCGREPLEWRCPACSGTRMRAARVGSARTAEEIARTLAGHDVLESSSTHEITRRIGAEPVVVVATAGAEPEADGGYAGVVVLDAHAIAGRSELWAPQEAMRRWFNAFSLLAPGAHGLLVGAVEPAMGQALVRWDPVDAADRLLDEREALGFFPAASIIALDGAADDVSQVCGLVGAEILGTVDTGTAPDGTPLVRALLRAGRDEADRVLAALADAQSARASRRLGVVKATVNPPELF